MLGFPFTLLTATVGHFMASKTWLHKMADRLNSRREGKPSILQACLCWLLYFTLLLSNHAFHNKWFQMLFKEQLAQSMTLVPFNHTWTIWTNVWNSPIIWDTSLWIDICQNIPTHQPHCSYIFKIQLLSCDWRWLAFQLINTKTSKT